MKSEETGEQHKLKLYDFQPDGTGRLDWAAAKKAFGADLLEIKDEGTPGLLQEVGRIGLTIDTYKPEENILVIVGRRAQGMNGTPHADLCRCRCTPAPVPGVVTSGL